jgi:anti-sigma B factor antagonist
MVMEIRDVDDVVVVTLTDVKILDTAAIAAIGEEFKNLTLQAAADKKLVVNFRRVQFMSSAMIGQIMQLYKMCKKDKVALKLCNIHPNIMEVFQVMGLKKLLSIYDTEEEAVGAFGKSFLGRFRNK